MNYEATITLKNDRFGDYFWEVEIIHTPTGDSMGKRAFTDRNDARKWAFAELDARL